MPVLYTAEIIQNPQGVGCRVININALDFTQAKLAKKSAVTRLRSAKGGEKIETKNAKGDIENTYIAQKGDALFINPHLADDCYVPANADGTRWQFKDIPLKGYDIVGTDPANDDLFIKSNQNAYILLNIIQEPSCIKNAFGHGQHQFLFKGASLKKSHDGQITGIDQDAFNATWEVVKSDAAQKNPTPPPKL